MAVSLARVHRSRRRPTGQPSRLVVALVVITALVVACATVSDGSDGSALDAALATGAVEPLGATVLARTLDASLPDAATSFEGTIGVVTAGGSGEPVIVAVHGAYDLAAGSGRIVADLDPLAAMLATTDQAAIGALMGGDPIEVVTVGGASYGRGGPVAVLGPRVWVNLGQTDLDALMGSTGFGGAPISPAQLFGRLEGADASLTELGRETVRGLDSRRVRALVDRGQLGGPAGGEPVPIDFWVADDGLVLRVAVDATTIGDDGTEPGMRSIDSVLIDIELFDHGTSPDIEAPPADEVVSVGGLGGLDG